MNYWNEYGIALWENGFTVVPIIPPDSPRPKAGKRPAFEDWQKIENTRGQINGFVKKYASSGIGILTKHTPAVDIDVYDKDGVKHMMAVVEKKIGAGPVRVGRQPKKLVLCHTSEPFKKVKSATWEDDFGQRHAVEILGDGQQFVAFGIHPDTRKEYNWITEDTPVNCAAALDLPEITLEIARDIADAFDAYAEKQGWMKVARAINGRAVDGEADDDDWAAMSTVTKWDGTYDELRDIVMKYPDPENYENWIRVMAALQVSCRDQDEAKEIARDWSMQADNYDESEFEYKWEKGFTHDAQTLVTIGTIIKTVHEIEEKEAREQVSEFTEAFNEVTTMADWKAWADDFRKLRVFGIERQPTIDAAKKAYKRLNESALTNKAVKEYLSFDFSRADTPNWLKEYVFAQAQDAFVSRKTGVLLSKGAFDSSHGRDIGDVEGGLSPNKFATDVVKIPIIHDVMYYPEMHGGMQETKWTQKEGLLGPEFFFDDSGLLRLNTFSPESIPKAAEKLSKLDKKAISIVKDLFIVLFPDTKERTYVMDWLAHIVQHPTKRINYSLLIRGAHGSGKSTIGVLMREMLGAQNIGYVSNSVMNGRFTDWAEGHILKIVEEVYDKGDRYSAVDKQKEFISNDRFQVEGKGVKPRDVVNTSSKLMFTNHINALPLDENQRRYLVVSTQAENHMDMDRVYGSAKEREKFFSNVYRAIENHGPAIKKWFLEWEISPDFNHKGHAPQDTRAFQVMMEASSDGVGEMLATMIRENETLGVCKDLIFSPALKDAFMEMPDVEMPKTNRLKNLLLDLGFEPGGLLKIDGVTGRCFTRRNVRAAKRENGKLNTVWAVKTLKDHNQIVENKIGKAKNPFDDEDDDEV